MPANSVIFILHFIMLPRRVLRPHVAVTLLIGVSLLLAVHLTRHDYFRRSPNSSASSESVRLPDAILIGIGKCGTMAAGFFLGLNSGVSISRNEVNYFCNDEKLARGLDYYQELLVPQEPGKISIERSPDYWKEPVAAKRIKETCDAFDKKIKLMFVACNPTSRVLSWYVGGLYHYMEEGRPNEYPSLEKLVYYRDREEVAPFYTGIRTSRYDLQLPAWLELFNRSQIHIINGDELKKNPVPEINRIERFLGLQVEITDQNTFFNETKGFYCRVRNGRRECLDHTKGHKYPDLNQETVRKITDFFRPHNKNFTSISGVDFGWPK